MGDLTSECFFRRAAQMFQDVGGDIDRGKKPALCLDAVAGIGHLAFDGADDIGLALGQRLARIVADGDVILAVMHHGRDDGIALRIVDGFGDAFAGHRHHAVGGAEVDADGARIGMGQRRLAGFVDLQQFGHWCTCALRR